MASKQPPPHTQGLCGHQKPQRGTAPERHLPCPWPARSWWRRSPLKAPSPQASGTGCQPSLPGSAAPCSQGPSVPPAGGPWDAALLRSPAGSPRGRAPLCGRCRLSRNRSPPHLSAPRSGGGKGVWVRCPSQQGKGVTPRKRGTTERVQYRGLGEIDIGGGGQLMKGGWGRDGGGLKKHWL